MEATSMKSKKKYRDEEPVSGIHEIIKNYSITEPPIFESSVKFKTALPSPTELSQLLYDIILTTKSDGISPTTTLKKLYDETDNPPNELVSIFKDHTPEVLWKKISKQQEDDLNNFLLTERDSQGKEKASSKLCDERESFLKFLVMKSTSVEIKTSVHGRSLFQMEAAIISDKNLLQELKVSANDVIQIVSALRLGVVPALKDPLFTPVWKFRNATKLKTLFLPDNFDQLLRGNGQWLNKNLENDVLVGYDTKSVHFQTLFHATSIVLYGSPQYAPLLQLGTYCTLAMDKNTWIGKEDLKKIAMQNIFDNQSFPLPPICGYLQKFADRNVILHVGSYPPSNISYNFGPRKQSKMQPINICVYEWQCHPVISDNESVQMSHNINDYSRIRPLVRLPEKKQDRNITTTLFDFPETAIFKTTCDFCSYYHLETCLHILGKHVKAKDALAEKLDSDVYGNVLEMPEVPKTDKSLTERLPECLRNFVAYEVPGDNNCQYHSVSVALTGEMQLSYPLRRCVAAEFAQHEKFYTTCFEEMKYTKQQMEELKKRVKLTNGWDSWGSNETFMLLSKITARQIIVFSLDNSDNISRVPPPAPPRIYDFRSPTAQLHSPLFIGHINNVHFQPLLSETKINKFDVFFEDNQFKLLKKMSGEYFSTGKILHIYKHRKKMDTQTTKLRVVSVKDSNLKNVSLPKSFDTDKITADPIERDVLNQALPIHQSTNVESYEVQTDSNSSLANKTEEIAHVSSKKEYLLLNGVQFECTDFDSNLLPKINININSKSDLAVAKLYFNVIVSELKNLKCKERIDTFIHNSSIPSYWKEKMQPWQNWRKLNSNDKRKTCSRLVAFQEKQDYRNLTEAVFRTFAMPQTLSDYYVRQSTLIYNQQASSRNVTNTNYETERIGCDIVSQSRNAKRSVQAFTDCAKCVNWWHALEGLPSSTSMNLSEENSDSSNKKVQSIAAVSQGTTEENMHTSLATSTSLHPKPESVDLPNLEDSNKLIYLSKATASTNSENKQNLQPITTTAEESIETEKEIYPDELNENTNDKTNTPSDEELEEKREFAASLNIPEEVLNYKPPMKFQISIHHNKVEKIYDFEKNEFVPRTWADVISDSITDVQKCCSFNAERIPQYNNPDGAYVFCTMRGHCPCSMKFVITIDNPPKIGEELLCNVESQGKFRLMQGIATGRQLRGKKRKALAQRLSFEKPGRVHLLSTNNNTTLRLLHNNNAQKSIKVLQKIRHETRHAIAASKDPFEDIVFFCEEKELTDKGEVIRGFIQEKTFLPNEINIHMYTESSLRLLLGSQHKDLVLHLDATGNCIQDKYGKRMLYYLALMKTNTGISFPLAAMLSQTGKASDIAKLFTNIKRDIKKIRPSFNKPLASVCVSDFSFAMLSSLCSGVNTQTMRDYIRDAYDIILEKDVLEQDRSVIFVCTPHIIKSYMRLLSKHVKPKKVIVEGKPHEIRQLAVHGFAKIISSQDLPDFVESCQVFCQTFCSETISNEKLVQNIEFLTNCELSADDVIDASDQIQIDFDEIFPSLEHNSLRERSKFYVLFKQLRNNKLLCENSDTNILYNEEITDLLQNYYIQYAPFYCSMMLVKSNRTSESRFSNSIIESEFNFIKNNFGNHDRFPINIFVRNIYEYHTGRVLNVLSDAANKSKRRAFNRKKSLKRLNTSSQPEQDHVEVWSRRPKQKRKPKFVKNPKVRLPVGDLSDKAKQNDLEHVQQYLSSNTLHCSTASTQSAENYNTVPTQNQSKVNLETESQLRLEDTSTLSDEIQQPKKKSESEVMLDEVRERNKKKLWEPPQKSLLINGSLIIFERRPKVSLVEGTTSKVPVSELSDSDYRKLTENRNKAYEQDLENIVEIEKRFEDMNNFLFGNTTKSEQKLKSHPKPNLDTSTENIKKSTSSTNEVLDTLSYTQNVTTQNVQLQSKSVKEDKNYYATTLAACDGMLMDSRQMLSFSNPNLWMETEHIDFSLRYLRISTGTDITITRSAFNYMTSRERNEWVRARHSLIPWTEDLILLDVQRQNFHLHPLYMMNHFVLLELQKQDKTCIIYDSMMKKHEKDMPGTLQEDRKLIHDFVLPDFFLDENEHKNWNVIHNEQMPQQIDEINCGLYVISAATNIVKGEPITEITCVKSKRLEILRSLLTTTKEGQELLNEAQSNDDHLLRLITKDALKAEEAYRIRQGRDY